MCLDHGETKKRAFIRNLKFGKDKYIKLWKVFDINEDGEMVAQFNAYTFQKGKNTAEGKIVKTYKGYEASYQYELGFHCFLTKKDCEDWLEVVRRTGRSRIIKPVKIKKSWITNIGHQEFQFSYKLVIVCKHIVI